MAAAGGGRYALKVFISWSGEGSQIVAEALRDWLKGVLQFTEPWISSRGIAKGSRGAQGIAAQLEGSRVGIVCLTPENLDSNWVHFEAGAISRAVRDGHVCTYLIGLKPSDVAPPLGEFQATRAERDDTLSLVRRVNELADEKSRLEEPVVEKGFGLWWPELSRAIEEAERFVTEVEAVERSEREMLAVRGETP